MYGNFTAHFDAWSIFVAILKLEDHFVSILKFGNHLATKWEFRNPFIKLGAFSQQMEDLAGGSYGAAKTFRSQMGI